MIFVFVGTLLSRNETVGTVRTNTKKQFSEILLV